MASDTPTVVIAAGGTGGHIFPGLALAEALQRACPRCRLSFVGTRRGLEGRLIPDAGHRVAFVDMVPFAGRGWRKALVPIALARASWQARRLLRAEGADVAVSMGGYSGIPLVIGARLTGVPALVHEPGAVPGQANRLAARFTDHVATSFPGTDDFPASDVRHVGYPLRGAFRTFDREALRGEARAAFGLDDGVAMVFVTGGSQGAASLNRLALGLAERWAGRQDVRIVLKAGARNHDEVAAALATNPGSEVVELVEFIDRIDHAYAAADVAVCRAGAGTVSELAVVGLPAVLVPFPHDEHDEQLRNAGPLVDAGGAVVVPDGDATAERVGPIIESWLDDRSQLEQRRSRLHSIASPAAADELAQWVLELAEGAR